MPVNHPRQPNAVFAASNATFRAWCETAGIKPTSRQASKYRRGQGLAFSLRRRHVATYFIAS